MKYTIFAICVILAVAGCKRDDMADQARVKTLGKTAYYADGASARPLVSGTVTRDGVMNRDDALSWANPIAEGTDFPWRMTMADLRQGQELFAVYCTPCHGLVGDGDGMVVRRGVTRPPSYHVDRLRAAMPGHFYNVMTEGWGAMYSFKDKIGEDDRWRVAAYIKALELSQHVPQKDLKAGEMHE